MADTDNRGAVDLIGHFRILVEKGRALAGGLEAGLAAAERVASERQAYYTQLTALEKAHQALREAQEGLLREREALLAMLDSLRGEHQNVKHALAELQDQHRAVLQDRLQAAEALEAVAQRLRG
jgi:uncharacterized coiled-coil DUF342 family protein